MLFDKKIKRSMEVMDERNRRYLDAERTDGHPYANDDAAREHEQEYRRLNEEPGLEKGDVPALILSALLVFGPILLILAALLTLAWVLLS
jgi:hypothetical protein